ncbi:MAG TPA: nucleoside hydrolase-like domain-containing protein [Prolixibacteraceae bacterium]|nr:nucleoside hydrolase-like domain-containing protein [Prolixibacteraceae bacterium]
MRKKIYFLIFVFLGVSLHINVYGERNHRPRIIVTTDGETDDKASFVRFLLYTTDFDVEALIYTNSKWHLEGNGTQWMHNFIDVYGKVYPNLIVHDSRYPPASVLKSKVFTGQMQKVGREAVGEGFDTQGSDKIVDVLLDNDPRPVWLQAWGGLNNIAQALYRIKASHPEKLEMVAKKAKIYAIAEQDNLKNWIIEEFPDVQYILNSKQFWRVIAYAGDRKNPFTDHELYTPEWTEKNVKSVSKLGAIYDRNELEEGDSPAFLHFVDTGLRSHLNPHWGGWGGRFAKTNQGNLWMDAEDDGDVTKPLWRFIVPISEDFAARMQWTNTSDYEDANHAPMVKLAHKCELTVKAGDVLKLDASPAYDPDDDKLSFKWWQYVGAGSFKHQIEIDDQRKPVTKVKIPLSAKGNEIHMICNVKDDAEFPMTRYARVIIKVE